MRAHEGAFAAATCLRDFSATPHIVGIATSTGGPPALQRLLSSLPADFPAPILVVQHISPGFEDSLATWLDSSGNIKVKVATAGEHVRPGVAYLAPRDRHLCVTTAGRVHLSDAPPVGGFRPSGTVLFRSLAESFAERVAGVILTGMGSDGVEGLRALHHAGGTVLAQDERSSVVWGMPGVAVEAGLAHFVLPIEGIARKLMEIVSPPPAANALPLPPARAIGPLSDEIVKA